MPRFEEICTQYGAAFLFTKEDHDYNNDNEYCTQPCEENLKLFWKDVRVVCYNFLELLSHYWDRMMFHFRYIFINDCQLTVGKMVREDLLDQMEVSYLSVIECKCFSMVNS